MRLLRVVGGLAACCALLAAVIASVWLMWDPAIKLGGLPWMRILAATGAVCSAALVFWLCVQVQEARGQTSRKLGAVMGACALVMFLLSCQ